MIAEIQVVTPISVVKYWVGMRTVLGEIVKFEDTYRDGYRVIMGLTESGGVAVELFHLPMIITYK